MKRQPGIGLRLAPLAAASSLSFFIGIAAGLLGVGGGEFRLPILICMLGFSVAVAAAANLIVGIMTVCVSLVKRLAAGVFDPAVLPLIIFMSLGSIAGAYAGAKLTDRVSENRLKCAVGVLLVLLGLKFIHGGLTGEIASTPVAGYPIDLVLGAVLGTLIGIVCGSLGVAGGELRIPALVYLFGMSTKGAGTASLFVSLPAVVAGALKHGRMGHVDRGVFCTCIAMGLPAVIGAYLGAALVPGTAEAVLKMLLGIVLLLAAVRMVIKH